MEIGLLIARDKTSHNSWVALLGALERERLAGECRIVLSSWDEIVGDYEKLAGETTCCLVCFSLMSSDVGWFAQTASRLRPVLRGGDLIVAGGPHPTAAGGQTLSLGADVVFRGEADVSFPKFIGALAGGGDWRETPGIAFRRGSRVVGNPPPEPIALDRVRSYFRPLGLLGAVELTRGCPSTCRFCQTPWLWGRRPRHRSPQSVLDEMANFRSFVKILSPNAFGYLAERRGRPNVRAIVGLLESARSRYPSLRVNFGIFPSEVRPEYVRRDLVRAIRPLVANRYLAVGAQSGSDRVLSRAGRGHTVGEVIRAVEAILGEGMGVLMDILFGLPGETAEDVALTRRLMRDLERWGVRFRVHLFTPLPGTPFAGERAGERLDRETAEMLDEMARRGSVEGWWGESEAAVG